MKLKYIGRSIMNLIYKTRMYFETMTFQKIDKRAETSIQEVMANIMSPQWHSYCLVNKFYDFKK